MNFNATTNGEILEFDDTERLHKFLGTLKGKKLTVTIKKYKKPRSRNQNNLYWEWMTIMGADLGYTPDEIHDTMKARLLVDRSGKLPVIRSTTALSTAEMAEYMAHVQRIASEFNIILPTPDEYPSRS